MQNLIELANGKCDLFNPQQYLNIRLLWQNRDNFIFISNNIPAKEIDDQAKLGSMLERLFRKIVL